MTKTKTTYSALNRLFAGVICLFFTMTHTHAQDTDSTKPITDSGYVEKFNNWINLKVALVNTSESYIAQGDNFKQVLKANPSQIFRTYLNYRFIAFYVDYIPRFLPGNNDEAEKGRSKGLGFGTGLIFHNWFTDLGFSHTKGYYLENMKDLNPAWQPGEPYFQVPDFHITSYDAAVGYNTNPRLSLVATSSQTSRQLKSAGAFIPRATFRYFITDNRTPGPGTTQKTNHFRAMLGAGYQHTFVISRSVYAMGAFTPYFGYIVSSTKTRNSPQLGDFTNYGPAYQWDAKLGLGYNGHRFFGGAYLTAGSAKFSQGLTSATQQDAAIFFQLFAGLRFKAPKFLDKALDKL
ncbi:DUF4421 domain-containing protein [Terrimonas sp. NA20]|uniref:DUF4421 domain-containing protein n=1 Tax=Terrimonas ginsenosidimutans TaxID=2908004 RepID=A0ABS9KMK2_9BACT|nr:DUF4421 family protein [Terrimonas ginsenosidimutans]MCG2613548.1 DUF4421 domain-containing protein [Terrimonas ginsenosidimutans]